VFAVEVFQSLPGDVGIDLRRREITVAEQELHDAEIEVELSTGTPPVHNSPEMAGLARAAAVRVVGEQAVQTMHTANMGGEDFGYFLQQIPGAYIRIGGQAAGREGYPAHSSRFDVAESALRVGAEYFRSVALMAGARLAREAVTG